MNANQNNVGRDFWLAWFLVSSIGYGMGALLGMSTAWRFFPAGNFGITFGTVMGATGGYFQWVVLRERVAETGRWALTGALGFAAAMGALV